MKRRNFLKTLNLCTAGLILPRLALSQTMQDPKPNVIFILIDDLGWAEPGCYGNKFNETPNIDRLAMEGMKFTQAYSSAPVCSPYRASLMTGQYPPRVGITDFLRPDSAVHLSLELTTMAEMFKQAGYTTGIAGKWHLSGYRSAGAPEETLPDKHGFDEVIVSEKTGIAGGSYFHPYKRIDETIPKKLPGKTEYLVDRLNVEAVEFIRRHKDKPFFFYLSHYAVHTKLQGKPKLVEKFEKKPGAGKGFNAPKNNPHLAAQLFSIDEGVGKIMNTIKDTGIADNTIIIFTGDNGGEDKVTSNAPFRAGKSTLYEGGIRVPLIIKWPGKIKPASVCDVPSMNIDFYPTFTDIVGIKPDPGQKMDGISILPLFKGDKMLRREALYWHYPLEKPHFLGGRSTGAVRKDDWKLIEFFDDKHFELYNLAEDVGEKNDLKDKYPQKVQELKKLLEKWQKEVNAKIPESPAPGK